MTPQNKRTIKMIFTLFFLITFPSINYAYYETHPPYQFKQGPFRHVPDKPLLDKDIPLLIKKDNEQISDEILIFRK